MANRDAVKLLLDKGADINAKSPLGITALMCAAIVGKTDNLKLLLDGGADINAKDSVGGTAFMKAALAGQTDTVKLLLDKGADINEKDLIGETALMACVTGAIDAATGLAKISESEIDAKIKMLSFLLNNGADVNTKADNGTTVIMRAIDSGFFEAAKLLLAAGADVNTRNKDGKTALMKAVEYGEMVDPATGASVKIPESENDGKMKIIKLLLDKGADVNAKDNHGNTALMDAAWEGKPNMVLLLLEKGADINAKENYGNTALMNVATGSQTDMVKFLLDKGSDVNAKNNHGDTALMLIADESNIIDPSTRLPSYHAPDYLIKTAELLLDKGADKYVVNKNGETALDRARKSGETAVVKLLQPVNPVAASGMNTDSSGYVTNVALLTPFTLTNSAGDVITNAVLVKLTANKFVYKTPNGGGMLPLASLSENMQKKFGYDPKVAKAADDDAAQKKARQQELVQQQREIAAQQAVRQNARDETPAAENQKVSVSSVFAKIVEGGIYNTWSWQATFANKTAEDIITFADIQFIDKQGFVIEHTPTGVLKLHPYEKKTISDTLMINKSLTSQIVNLGVHLHD